MTGSPMQHADGLKSWLGWIVVGLGVAVSGFKALTSASPLIVTVASTPAIAALALLPLVLQDDRFRTRLEIPLAHRDRTDAVALTKNWEISARYFANVHWQARAHLALFGMLTSAALWFSIDAAISHIGLAQVPGQSVTMVDAAAIRGLLAVVFVSAVATTFGLSSGSIGLRIARRDLTPRFVALQTRSLFYVVISALVWGALLIHTQTIDNWSKALLAGACTGLLGEQIMVTAFESIALIFGVSLGGDQLDEFDVIQGLDDDERLRVKELGVQSMQGLAYCSTSALYMSSRYPYQCICDWQDQALLVLHMGPRDARVLQERGLRRASDVAAWLCVVQRTRLMTVVEHFSLGVHALLRRLDKGAEQTNSADFVPLKSLLQEVKVPQLDSDDSGELQRMKHEFSVSLTDAAKVASKFRDVNEGAATVLGTVAREAEQLFQETSAGVSSASTIHVEQRLAALGLRNCARVRVALEALRADSQTLQMALLRECYPELSEQPPEIDKDLGVTPPAGANASAHV